MKCQNCGAARKLNDEQCEYCDAYFYVPEDKRNYSKYMQSGTCILYNHPVNDPETCRHDDEWCFCNPVVEVVEGYK